VAALGPGAAWPATCMADLNEKLITGSDDVEFKLAPNSQFEFYLHSEQLKFVKGI
jgi:hypothetical protein